MSSPDLVTVPTCIGCGAMSQFGTCEHGCSEARLDLVSAIDYDELAAASSHARSRAGAYRAVAEGFISSRPGAQGYEVAYRAVQHAARTALRTHPPTDDRTLNPVQPPQRVTTWWCEGCGGIDAPQPCLGICIWRPIKWVNASLYDQEHTHGLADLETEIRLERVLRRVASITPLQHHWKRSWQALQAEARTSLRRAPGRSGAVPGQA